MNSLFTFGFPKGRNHFQILEIKKESRTKKKRFKEKKTTQVIKTSLAQQPARLPDYIN